MRKKLMIIGAIASMASLTVVFLTSSMSSPTVDKNPPSTGRAADTSRPFRTDGVFFPVKVAVVHRGDMVQWVHSSGYAHPYIQNKIKPNLAGQVVEVNAYDGKMVHGGDVLLRLDDRELQIQLQEAKDRLINAEVDFNLANTTTFDSTSMLPYKVRFDSLRTRYNEAQEELKEGKISQIVLDRIRRDYDAAYVLAHANREDIVADKVGLDHAKLQYEDAKLELGYATLDAPFDGLVADCSVQRGGYIQVGETCMLVMDISKIRIECEVPETELPAIRVGDIAEAKFIAFPGEVFEGRVAQVNPIVDFKTRTATVIIEVSNRSERIKPGMYSTVRIAGSHQRNVVLVPKSAVLFRDNRPLVFTVSKGMARWVYVRLGESNDDYYEVKSEISKGDTIVVEGNYNLVHEAKVKITAITNY